MRYSIYGAALGAAIAALAGCTPSVPDSGAGVGFGDYDSYAQQQAAREAQLSGQQQAGASAAPLPQSGGQTGAPLSATGQAMAPLPDDEQGTAQDGGQEEADPVEQLAADTAAALNSGEEPLQADPNNPPPEAVNEMGISQENDFEDVAGLRSIDDDADRIARNRQEYELVQPEALPPREGKEGPNIVAYALRTTNPVGTPLYNRMTLFDTEGRMQRNCRKYPSADQAQIDFLERGGPERDRLGLDPDGDGFACDWDPAPFRSARGGSGE
ncbi:MAG: hypothetical protein FH759_03030 [Sediminimonas qiaohouensis]|uniref:Excalibur calcium-binding domain-containing protein n=1 Tax=Sediminimonas qiaohouensis TaxID=552061 RepID=A0A7C9L9W4_9RHOB|nr:hypothetical protein [Sediminimonas qiaohouensis]MTJ03657.1 hypothetical protein [Sediminimonas qiaohouensis]